MKKVPLRKCIACMESKPKKDLLRIVKNKDGLIQVDVSGKLSGRGSYICYNEECLQKLKNQKKLEREFELHEVDVKIFDEIKGVIEKSDKQ